MSLKLPKKVRRPSRCTHKLIVVVEWRKRNLLEVGAEGVAPEEVAGAQEVEAVVGEVGAQAALVVGKQGIEVDPGDTVAAGHLLETF